MIVFNDVINFIDKAMEQNLIVTCSTNNYWDDSSEYIINVKNKEDKGIIFYLKKDSLYICNKDFWDHNCTYHIDNIDDFQKSIFMNRYELTKIYASRQIEEFFNKYFIPIEDKIVDMNQLDDAEKEND